MIYLLNNWQNLDHAKLYKHATAFFDLYATGPEAKYGNAMKAGDVCIVLSQGKQGRCVFEKYTLVDVCRADDCLVMRGDFMWGETVLRPAAIHHPVYKRFFNVRGHVNQWSVLNLNQQKDEQ